MSFAVRGILCLGLTLTQLLPCAAQQVVIGGYPVPTRNSLAVGYGGITTGPDGALWFTENNASKIGRMTPAGVMTEYVMPAGSRGPEHIVKAHGALWFAADSNQIGRITTAGVFTMFDVPTAGAQPYGITLGADGALWFTEELSYKIGRMTPAGAFTEYDLPVPSSFPKEITPGPDGALWFTNFSSTGSDQIGRITTAGLITEYVLPTAFSGALGIARGPDGALWFTEQFNNKIGRITTLGAITEYPVPTANANPYGISNGPNGDLWFTEYSLTLPQIASISTTGVITEYPEPNTYSRPDAITSGPDGSLWFLDEAVSGLDCSNIGQALLETAVLTANPAQGRYQALVTFSGTGFAANERVKVFTSGVGSAALAVATTDASGAFTATARQPQWPAGSRMVLAQGQSSGRLAGANYAVLGREVLNPSSGPPGTAVTASGYGCLSLSSVGVIWHMPRTYFGAAQADINGNVAFSFVVPDAAAAGAHIVSMGEGCSAQAVFTVQ